MDQVLKQSLLYDFYGELLTDHQKEIYIRYQFDDLSLGEIAKEVKISRQGVYDIIKRCDKQLNHYEDKLHLVEKFQRNKHRIEQVYALTKDPGSTQALQEIRSISEQILADL